LLTGGRYSEVAVRTGLTVPILIIFKWFLLTPVFGFFLFTEF
jgi:hypothetical protein